MSAEERSEKNTVFNAQPVEHSIARGGDSIKQDIGLDIPIDVVPLPSEGKLYPQGHPLHLKETVQIRAMTAREEDILTSSALIKNGTVINELIKSCLVDKSIDVNTLLAGDRNAIMVAIRITGYGPEYNGEIKCGQCGAKTQREFDLSELPIKSLEIDPIVMGMNAFEFRLPVSKKTVRFKFMTGVDETNTTKSVEAKKKAYRTLQESNVTTQLSQVILAVDNHEGTKELQAFINNMPARDSNALRAYIKAQEPGITMKAKTYCAECSSEEEVAVPLGPTFFWPSAE